MNITQTLAKDYKWFKGIPFIPILIDEQVKVFTMLFRPVVFKQMIHFNKWMKAHDGIVVKYHRYGGLEYRIKNREICHMHGDGLVDVKTNREMKSKFIPSKYAKDHHVLSESGMLSLELEGLESLLALKIIIKEVLE